ncbi:MAG: undecaprenyl-phosphate glucose phosphotransferase [Steroidobacteraceae bacterium]
MPTAAATAERATPASLTSGSGGILQQAAFRLGSTEPPSVTLLKELLGPSVAVASLAVCAGLANASAPFSLRFAALALIVFVISQRLLSVPQIRVGEASRVAISPSIPRLLLEWGIVCVVLLFLRSALRLTSVVGTDALTDWSLITPAALIGSNAVAMRLGHWLGARRAQPSRYIIIGATPAGLELARRVRLARGSGRFLGFFDFRDLGRLPPLSPELWRGPCQDVGEFVQRHTVGTIYIALPICSTARITALLQELRDTTASIYLVPANIFEFELVQPRCLEIHGIPALAVCESPHQGIPGLGKRAFDLSLAILTLLVAGPLMIAIAAAVKLSSTGPVFFKQRRYGLNGEQIIVYKFRTMIVCEDGPMLRQATRNDCRVTRVGRWLRRRSLDELPQLFNILEGRMSFVGPRPHAIAHNELYRKLVSGYMVRHKVRPGITGWAQVNGLRGETDTVSKIRRRVEHDLYYLNHWSLWLDLQILLRTLRLVIRDEHAY